MHGQVRSYLSNCNRGPKLGASLDSVWRCVSVLHDRVGDDTDALDFALDNVAGLEPDLRLAEAADA